MQNSLLQWWCSSLLYTICAIMILSRSAESLHCYVCSSDKLEQCSTLHSTKELPSELCPTEVASCVTKVEDGITVRGCLGASKTDTGCNNSTCVSCKKEKCNAQIFPEDRLSCLHCQGPTCVNQTNTIDVRFPCVKYVPQDECFTIFTYDGTEAFRGCMSDPIENGRDVCMNNPEQCTRCKDRACNAQGLEFEKPLSCIKCTPNGNHNCNNVDKNTTAIECAKTVKGYENFCYTHHDEQKTTRGCLYEAPDPVFDTCKTNTSAACTICNKSDCNRAPITNANIPSNGLKVSIPGRGKSHHRVHSPSEAESRLHCYHCNGTEGCDFMDKPFWRPTPCGISSKYDRCFTFIQAKDQKIYRGCLSDSSNERLMCGHSEKYQLGFCDTCSGSGCNNQPKLAKPKLSCVKCNDDKACALAQNLYDAKPCQKNVRFGDEESCFTHHFKNSTKVMRGCTLDMDRSDTQWCNEEDGCETCSTPGCNMEAEQLI